MDAEPIVSVETAGDSEKQDSETHLTSNGPTNDNMKLVATGNHDPISKPVMTLSPLDYAQLNRRITALKRFHFDDDYACYAQTLPQRFASDALREFHEELLPGKKLTCLQLGISAVVAEKMFEEPKSETAAVTSTKCLIMDERSGEALDPDLQRLYTEFSTKKMLGLVRDSIGLQAVMERGRELERTLKYH